MSLDGDAAVGAKQRPLAARRPPCSQLTYLLFLLPPVLLGIYFLLLAAPPPIPPLPLAVHPGLDSLPASIGVDTVYPENWLSEGGWAVFPFGRTRYWIHGPEDGTRVVCIHGLSVPAPIYAPLLPHIQSANNTGAGKYRVLVYDLPARGYSSALPPFTNHDAAIYTTHLALLLQHVGWKSVHAVVGLSMGGAIAAAFTASFPNLVDADGAVILLASGGLLEARDLPRTAKLVASPVVQTFLTHIGIPLYATYTRFVKPHDASELATFAGTFDLRDVARLPREYVDPKPLGALVRVQAAHLLGFNAAISSSLRVGPVRGMSWAFQSLAETDRRVLIVHGTADMTVPPTHAARIAELVRGEPMPLPSPGNITASSSSSPTPTPAPTWLCATLRFGFLCPPPPPSSFSANGSRNGGGDAGARPDRVRVLMVPEAGHALTWTHAGGGGACGEGVFGGWGGGVGGRRGDGSVGGGPRRRNRVICTRLSPRRAPWSASSPTCNLACF
ncbi:AB hydrolase-1 domain-containing protein [Mycena kentingensis (nom. inval.)]|nr:AB hydrolase-1 domain-containing protein [Mycena kentingensis (nom. inval.)]